MHRRFISYPKSGRSRIRYGLHVIGLAESVDFNHDGFEFNDGAKPPHDFSVEKRVKRIKPDDRVVFLKRDPRDLIVSLFHQVTGRFNDFFQYTGSISDFIRDPYFGAEVMKSFFDMWDQVCAQRPVLVMTYEDCMKDPASAFEKIGAHYGFDASAEQWRLAAEKSSFDKMKEVEDSGEFEQPWLRKRQGHSKVRRGKVGGYADSLSPEDVAYLNEIFALSS